MAIELASAYVSLVPSAKGIAGKIADELDGPTKKAAEDSGDQASSAFSKKFGGGLGKIGAAVGGAFAFDKGIEIGGALLSLGTELDILDRKTSTVFESAAGSVRSWADANNEAFGISDEKLAGLAAGFGDLLKPMGFTADEAANMSTKVVGLSGALAAWGGNKRSAAEVSEILAKAMLGERDGLKELGISISENDVQQRLAQKGQEKLTGAALEQAKALATQELIFEKSTDAQKAWADGSFSGVQAQNTLRAKLDDLKAAIAERLLPAFNAATEFIVGTVIPAIGGLSAWVQEHKTVVLGVAVVIAGALVAAFVNWAIAAGAAAVATIVAIAPVLAIGAAIAALVAGIIWAYQNWGWFHDAVNAVRDFIVDKLVPALQALWAFIRDRVIPVVAAIATGFADFARDAWNAVSGFVTDAIGVLTSIISFVTDMPGRVRAAASGLFDGIKEAFRGAINWIIGAWNGLEFRVPEIDTHIPGIGKVGGFVLGMPDIPFLAGGGVITEPTVALLGETARARPEIAAPASMLRSIFASELARTPARSHGDIHLTVNGSNLTAQDVARELAWTMKTAR